MPSPELRLASVLDRTEGAEGPGARFVVWAQGCSLGCEDCCNPHMWNPRGGSPWKVEALLARLDAAREEHSDLEGVTLIGGEPFEQDAAFAAFAEGVRARDLSVMAFTGYRLEELRERESALLAWVDLLVDGRYQVEEYTAARRWIGSENQGLHFLSEAYAPTDPRFAEANRAELRYDSQGEVLVVGFPFPSVRAAFGPGRTLPRAGEGAKA